MPRRGAHRVPITGGMKRMLLELSSLAALLAACSRPLPEAPARADAAFAQPAAIDLPGLREDPAQPFVLLPGDELRLVVLSLEPVEVPRLVIDATGRVHAPLIGAVEIGGLSTEDAEQRLEDAYRRADRFARVVLSVHEAKGHRASVVGTVNRPGSFPLGADTRLVELLALAGGPVSATSDDGESIEVADLGAARVVRGDGPLPISVRLALEGDPRHNVLVRAGDVVYVPPSRASRVSVIGEVGRPRTIPYRAGMRLSQALAIAGGPTRQADRGDIRVVRGSLERPRVLRASLKALVDGAGYDVELAPGDVVFVTEHWFATTTEVVSRVVPALAVVGIAGTLAR